MELHQTVLYDGYLGLLFYKVPLLAASHSGSQLPLPPAALNQVDCRFVLVASCVRRHFAVNK